MEKIEAIRELKKFLKPNMTVYTILRHCSSSGMFRTIDLIVIQRGKYGLFLRNISYLASVALEWKLSKRHAGIELRGCDMDIGFHLVYSLGRALWPHGTRKPHGMRNGEPDKDDGYALKHSWL